MHGAHTLKIKRIKLFVYLTVRRHKFFPQTRVDTHCCAYRRLYKPMGQQKQLAAKWIT